MLQNLSHKFLELRQSITGDVLIDYPSRLLYATDASIYQQLPLVVVRPAHKKDILQVLRFAQTHQIAVIPRAAGTSLAGQVVGEAIVVDISRYMNHILAVDCGKQTAVVEPGVVIERLNRHIQHRGLKFAPDPSTLNRCTISGVIGNNAWGAHAPVFGSTRNHILETEIALPNGDVISNKALDNSQFTEKLTMPTNEGKIYRLLKEMIGTHGQLIHTRYPSKKDLICNAGYALHELAQMQPWNLSGPPFNLSALLCGSEGTLGFVTKAKVKLTPIPSHSIIIGAHYESINDALQSVSVALQHRASAVELLDEYLLNLTKTNTEQALNRFWIKGDPKAVLLIELYDDHLSALEERANNLIREFLSQKLGYEFSVVESQKSGQVWSMRRAALGLLMGMPGSRKAVSFIEDSAVPVKHLSRFVQRVQAIMQRHGTECVYYGSVSMGLIHLRPLLDLHQAVDRQTLKSLAQEVAELLRDYNGTISAKHGDGIVRSGFIEAFFGKEIVQCLEAIKSAFDPDGLLNPGKIVHPRPIDSNLRYPTNLISTRSTGFHWQSGGFFAAAEKCNGAGACRKQAGAGTMCPSYMATGEEQHSTRGRSNTLRQILQAHKDFDATALLTINDCLKFCLSCKGCRSECPANVDMARMKAECLYQTNRINGVTMRTRLIGNLNRIIGIGSRFPVIANAINRLPITNRLLGFSPQRRLPPLAKTRLSRWFTSHTPHANAGTLGHVILLNDLISEYYEPTLGCDAIELLERFGYRVTLSPCLASVRLSISLGLLDQAHQQLCTAIDWLNNHSNTAMGIVGIEPSELLTYRDEATELLTGRHLEKLLAIQDKTSLLDEFVSKHNSAFSPNITFKKQPLHIALHVHCHQKSLSATESCVSALRVIPGITIERIPSGCCGMAGIFGYEKDSYKLSEAIGELVLFPAIRKLPADTKVVATGASCRQQIADFLKIKAYHPAEIIRQQIIDPKSV